MRVAMLAPEAHPYAKTGGLGDVLGALPGALAAAGVEVTLCLPAYRSVLRRLPSAEATLRLHAPVASRMEPAEIVPVPGATVPTVLVRADRYFDRDALHGPPGGEYPDNAERFAFFCRAALEWLRRLEPPPDVLHLHDWQTSLAAAFLRGTAALYPELATVRTVLTVHNLAYQGRFPFDVWPLLNLDVRYFAPSWLEFYGQVNYLKAGLLFADAITTVSPRYAEEIQTPSFGSGLDGVLRMRADRLRGILNGVDDAVWNPASDPFVPAHYDQGDLRGKARCKAALQADLGLAVSPEPAPLAVVSRLAEQKGLELLGPVLPGLLKTRAGQLVAAGRARVRAALYEPRRVAPALPLHQGHELGRAVDHLLGACRAQRVGCEAPAHSTERDPRCPGGADVDPRVAHEQHVRERRPGPRPEVLDPGGIGLPHGQRVAADDVEKAVGEPEPLEARAAHPHGLVEEDGKGDRASSDG